MATVSYTTRCDKVLDCPLQRPETGNSALLRR